MIWKFLITTSLSLINLSQWEQRSDKSQTVNLSSPPPRILPMFKLIFLSNNLLHFFFGDLISFTPSRYIKGCNLIFIYGFLLTSGWPYLHSIRHMACGECHEFGDLPAPRELIALMSSSFPRLHHMLCLGLVFALVMSSFLIAFLNSCRDLQFDRNMDLGLEWIYSNYLLLITFLPD